MSTLAIISERHDPGTGKNSVNEELTTIENASSAARVVFNLELNAERQARETLLKDRSVQKEQEKPINPRKSIHAALSLELNGELSSEDDASESDTEEACFDEELCLAHLELNTRLESVQNAYRDLDLVYKATCVISDTRARFAASSLQLSNSQEEYLRSPTKRGKWRTPTFSSQAHDDALVQHERTYSALMVSLWCELDTVQRAKDSIAEGSKGLSKALECTSEAARITRAKEIDHKAADSELEKQVLLKYIETQVDKKSAYTLMSQWKSNADFEMNQLRRSLEDERAELDDALADLFRN